MIQEWLGSKFEKEHEIVAQKKIIEICKKFFKHENAHLVFSFRINNADFDCVLFTKHKITIIELKQFKNDFVSGGENGNWKTILSNGIERSLHRNKNPFEQCSVCRSLLNKELRSFFKNKIQLQDMAKTIDAGIVSYPNGYPKNDGKISKLIENNPWFFYENLANLQTNVLESNKNSNLPFDFNKLTPFFIKRLSCKKEYTTEDTDKFEKHNKRSAKKEQEKAVKADLDINSIVIAGPGSGKTRYIINRAKYLINQKSIAPENIAFITFTNKGSDVIKSRLYHDHELSLTEEDNFYCSGTIHRICLQILENNDYYKKIGYTKKPTVLSSRQMKDKFTQFFSLNSNYSEKSIQKIANFYSLSINRFIHSDLQLISKYLSEQNLFYDKGKNRTEWYQSMVDKFLSDQKSENVIDFDSILLFAYELLSLDGLANKIARQCKFLFLDELQDLSRIQFKILKQLANAGTIISAVGDPAQAIYGFRGGNVDAFTWINNELQNTQTFFLSYNWRSEKSIIEVSEKFKSEFNLYQEINIDNLRCLPIKKDEGSVLTFRTDTEVREATLIADSIRKTVIGQDNISYNDFAILYRNRYHLNPNFSSIFNEFNIPCNYKDILKFSEKPLIQKILTVLDYIYSKELKEKVITDLFFSSPFSSKKTYKDLFFPMVYSLVSKNNKKLLNDESIDQLLSDLGNLNDLNNYQIREFDYFQDVLAMRANNNEQITKNILYYFQEIYPTIITIKGDFENEDNGYDEDVFRMLEIAENYGKDYESFRKKIKLEFVEDTANHGVTFSTMHGSKGGQWDVVILTGLNDSAFRTREPEAFVNQESNLFYVAMTRAKSQLVLSYSEINNFKSVEPSKYWMFINEQQQSGKHDNCEK